jgi:site-specific recombinase XerD
MTPRAVTAANGAGTFGHPLSFAGPLTVGAAVELFLAHQRRVGRQAETVRHTALVLRPFVAWAGSDALLSDVTLRSVELGFFPAWSELFERRRGHSPSTSYVRSLRLALRGLFRFADVFDLLVDAAGVELRNPLRSLEVPGSATPNIATVSTESEARILAAAHTPRQRIIVPFLRWTGLRVSEAAATLDEDVDLSQLEIRVRVSKTARGIRTIPLLPVLEEPVRAWRAYCQRYGLHQPGGTFLVTRHGTPMQSRHIWWTVRTVAARANVTAIGGHTVTPHTLRRTYATDLLNRGVRLEVVSRLLGHSTTAVTEKFYAHLSDARLRAELEAAFIASPYPGVQHETSQARSLDRAELAAHLRELAQTLES